MPQRFKVQLDNDALGDLADIREYIAEDRGRDVADGFIERVFAHLLGFEILPSRGMRRDDVRSGLRTVGWRRILNIAFSVDDKSATVIILGVFYRGRDLDAALRRRVG